MLLVSPFNGCCSILHLVSFIWRLWVRWHTLVMFLFVNMMTNCSFACTGQKTIPHTASLSVFHDIILWWPRTTLKFCTCKTIGITQCQVTKVDRVQICVWAVNCGIWCFFEHHSYFVLWRSVNAHGLWEFERRTRWTGRKACSLVFADAWRVCRRVLSVDDWMLSAYLKQHLHEWSLPKFKSLSLSAFVI